MELILEKGRYGTHEQFLPVTIFCGFPKPVPEFPTSYVVFLCSMSWCKMWLLILLILLELLSITV